MKYEITLSTSKMGGIGHTAVIECEKPLTIRHLFAKLAAEKMGTGESFADLPVASFTVKTTE